MSPGGKTETDHRAGQVAEEIEFAQARQALHTTSLIGLFDDSRGDRREVRYLHLGEGTPQLVGGDFDGFEILDYVSEYARFFLCNNARQSRLSASLLFGKSFEFFGQLPHCLGTIRLPDICAEMFLGLGKEASDIAIKPLQPLPY